MIRVLSWGCGVQSTTLGEMSVQGLIDPLDAIITADTGWERQATYAVRDWYIERWQKMGLRVEVVTAGDIRKLGAEIHIHIPFWTDTGGPLRRQCTRQFKITPVKRRAREIAGFHPTKPPHPGKNAIEQWLGISLDEWKRMRESRVRFIHHRWPLLELNMTRQDCIAWLRERDLPIPVKSACVCCPYRNASEWIAIRDEAPEEFAAAVAFDEQNRHNPLAARAGSTADNLYIWKGCESLAEADLETYVARERKIHGIQIPMFLCESGYCWV